MACAAIKNNAKRHEGRFGHTRQGIENLVQITQDLVKVSVCVTVLLIVSSIVFQYARILYIKGSPANLPAYYVNYNNVLKSPAEVGVYEDKEEDEKHFGKLLPLEHLTEEEDEDQSHNGANPTLFRRSAKKEGSKRDAQHEEAIMSIKKAKQLVSSGNKKLATKLFQHALALAPEFADGLNMYGEFLEDDDNILQANLLYQRALAYEPSHSTALANRERTMPLVEEIDKKMLLDIDKKKTELYKYPPSNSALRKAMKEFYYQHIYHTVALEGNTLTIEEIREIINSRRAIPGKSIFEHSEVIGVDEALKYLNSTLNIGGVTVDNIKEIHKRVIGYVDPVNAGVFRTNQVYVGKHIPPHPDDVPRYMEEFNDWLNSEDSQRLHPVEFAALAHYKLVYVHPFIDGNGRTSRLLMNLILMKHGFPPVSVQVSDRWEYYECLEAGNEGDIRPFIRFIARCVSFTLDDYLYAAENLATYPKLQGTHTRVIKTDGS